MNTHENQTVAVDAGVPQLITAKALTVRFGLTAKGVRALPIPKIKIGRRATRYHLTDVLEFLQRRTVRSQRETKSKTTVVINGRTNLNEV